MLWLVPAVFFGYMSVVCWAFFLMLGTVGFRASLMFVRHIYRCGAHLPSCALVMMCVELLLHERS